LFLMLITVVMPHNALAIDATLNNIWSHHAWTLIIVIFLLFVLSYLYRKERRHVNEFKQEWAVCMRALQRGSL
jgi:hypothetical protein